jgi:hypothetical protein
MQEGLSLTRQAFLHWVQGLRSPREQWRARTTRVTVTMAPRLRTYIDKGPESAQPIVCELRDRRIAAAIEWLRVGEQ